MRAQETFMSSGMIFVGIVIIAIFAIVFLLILMQRMFGVSI